MGKPYDLDNLASSAESSLRLQLMVQCKKYPLLWPCTEPNAVRHEQRKPRLRRSSTSLWVPHYFHADPRYLTHTHYPVHPQVDCSLFPQIPGTTQHGVTAHEPTRWISTYLAGGHIQPQTLQIPRRKVKHTQSFSLKRTWSEYFHSKTERGCADSLRG